MTRDPRTFDADHALMGYQRWVRRLDGVPLGAGSLVQAHVGGEIREVVSVVSAGEFLDAMAHRVVWPRKGGSSAEACALYGQRAKE